MNLKIVAKILNSLKRKVDKLVFDMLKTVATGLTKFPAGKYWSPGHPEDVPKDPFDRPGTSQSDVLGKS